MRPAADAGTLPRKRASLRTIVPARVAIATCGPAAVMTPSVAGAGGASAPPDDGGSPSAALGAASAANAMTYSSL